MPERFSSHGLTNESTSGPILAQDLHAACPLYTVKKYRVEAVCILLRDCLYFQKNYIQCEAYDAEIYNGYCSQAGYFVVIVLVGEIRCCKFITLHQ